MKIFGRALRARKIRFGDVRGMPKLFFPVEVRRDQTLRFRVTDVEKKLIEQKAADCGMSLSKYMLKSALGKPVRSKISATIINELAQICAELKLQRESFGGTQEYRLILHGIAEAIERIPADAQMEDF